MESKVSQKLFNLNINFLGSLNNHAESEAILELVNETGLQRIADETEAAIKPAADILEFTYPPESPFYKKQ